MLVTAQNGFAEEDWNENQMDAGQIDSAIEHGKRITPAQFEKASVSAKEKYVLSKNADFTDENQKNVFKGIVSREGFDVKANRVNVVKYMSNRADYLNSEKGSNDEQEKEDYQKIFKKVSSEDITVVNQNKEYFKVYAASSGVFFKEVVGDFGSYDKGKNEFVTKGSKSTRFTLDHIENLQKQGYLDFAISSNGGLVFTKLKYDHPKFKFYERYYIEKGVFVEVEGELYLSAGRIKTPEVPMSVRVPHGCTECRARLNNDGSVTVSGNGFILPEGEILIKGSATIKSKMFGANKIQYYTFSPGFKFIDRFEHTYEGTGFTDYFSDFYDHSDNPISYIQSDYDKSFYFNNLLIVAKNGDIITQEHNQKSGFYFFKFLDVDSTEGKVVLKGVKGRLQWNIVFENGEMKRQGVFPTLIRSRNLERDLEFYYGDKKGKCDFFKGCAQLTKNIELNKQSKGVEVARLFKQFYSYSESDVQNKISSAAALMEFGVYHDGFIPILKQGILHKDPYISGNTLAVVTNSDFHRSEFLSELQTIFREGDKLYAEKDYYPKMYALWALAKDDEIFKNNHHLLEEILKNPNEHEIVKLTAIELIKEKEIFEKNQELLKQVYSEKDTLPTVRVRSLKLLYGRLDKEEVFDIIQNSDAINDENIDIRILTINELSRHQRPESANLLKDVFFKSKQELDELIKKRMEDLKNNPELKNDVGRGMEYLGEYIPLNQQVRKSLNSLCYINNPEAYDALDDIYEVTDFFDHKTMVTNLLRKIDSIGDMETIKRVEKIIKKAYRDHPNPPTPEEGTIFGKVTEIHQEFKYEAEYALSQIEAAKTVIEREGMSIFQWKMKSGDRQEEKTTDLVSEEKQLEYLDWYKKREVFEWYLLPWEKSKDRDPELNHKYFKANYDGFESDIDKIEDELITRLNALPKTMRINTYYGEMFVPQKDRLHLTQLNKIKFMLDEFQKPKILTQIGDIIRRDVNNKFTEFGGRVIIEDDGDILYEVDERAIEIANKENNLEHDGYFIGTHTHAEKRGSVVGFHLHALEYDEATFAGPSIPDVDYAKATKKDQVVITSIGCVSGKRCFNADFFAPQNVVIDLGNYCYGDCA